MRWVALFLNRSPKNGKVVAVCGTLSDLLSVASSKLGVKATSVYDGKGGLIDDLALIRDDDVLFVCGEPFIDTQTDSKSPEGLSGFHTDWLTLNVGGRYFTTTQSTLVNKEPDSMLAHIGDFLIDQSPEYFEPILNYLCHGQLVVNDGINLLDMLEAARFFGIDSLIEHLEVSELRRQGLNFSGDPSGLKANSEGANLKGVDMEGSQITGINLRVTTLKNAKLKNCNLRGATLAGTDLGNCDLSGCDLQEANLRGSNMKGARFEEMLTRLHMSQSVR
uniref:KHA domain-containing protein n=1 Tax=Nomascus leucogenys TaxID=61853 RepID=A0A2I3GTG0_NOMLE